MAKERTPEELTEEELERADGEPLPDREQMTLIHGVQPLPQPIVIDDPPGLVEPGDPTA
jgi:hypothetical protein